MIKRKQKAIVFFFAIYLTFIAMAVALILFTPGLEITEEAGRVFLENKSVHVVKDIKVELIDGTPIDCIAQFAPEAKKELMVAESKRPTKIIATAAFHPTIEQTLLPLGVEGFALTHKITVQENIQAGNEFWLKLELCAENSDLKSLTAWETHDKSYLKEESQNRVIALKSGECREQEFEFTALKAGITEISFSLSAENYAKEISKELKVN